MSDLEFRVSELERQLNNLLRIGTISEVEHGLKRLKVKTGDLETGWLDWPAEIGNNYKRWRPLRLGTQVLIGSPSGDPAQAHIIGMLYSNTQVAPSNEENIDLIQFNDGSFIKHDANNRSLSIHAAGEMNLSYEKLNMLGPVEQTGGDITSDGVSAQHHTHGGVVPGGGDTAEPNK